MNVQLASVHRSPLIVGGLLFSSFPVLEGINAYRELIREKSISLETLLGFVAAACFGIALFLLLYRAWWVQHHGLRAITNGLVWPASIIGRIRLVQIPWNDITGVRVINDCNGDRLLFILLRRGACNPAPLRRYKNRSILVRARVICLHNDLWRWCPDKVKQIIDYIRCSKVPLAQEDEAFCKGILNATK